MVITSTGNYAWELLGVSLTDEQPLVDAICAPNGRGGMRLLDSGPAGSIKKLRARGRAIYWLKSDQTHSARLR